MSAITSESTPTSLLLPFEDKEASASISTILNRYAEQNARILNRGSTAYFLTEIVLTLLSTGKVKVYDPKKMPFYLAGVFENKVAFTDGHFIWLNKNYYNKVQKFHDSIVNIVSEMIKKDKDTKKDINTLKNLYTYSDSIHSFSPYVSSLLGLIMHEALHYILKHDVKVRGFISNEQEKTLYNIASDIYINTLIEISTLPSQTDNMLNHFIDNESDWGNLLSELILNKVMDFEDVVGFFYIAEEYGKRKKEVESFFKKIQNQMLKSMAKKIDKE
uniref:hypothetical protein n=1 Tax=Desulfurobacterium sp. TaxID=2004706 RepID=UPI0026236AF6